MHFNLIPSNYITVLWHFKKEIALIGLLCWTLGPCLACYLLILHLIHPYLYNNYVLVGRDA